MALVTLCDLSVAMTSASVSIVLERGGGAELPPISWT